MWPVLLGLVPLADLCHAMVISPVQFIHGTSSVHLQPDFARDHVQSQINHVAVSSDVRGALLRKFSPIVYLHPDDQYLPADPARTFHRFYNATTDSMSFPSSEYGGMPLSYDDGDDGDRRRGSDNLDDLHPGQSLTHHSPSNTSTDDYNDFRRPGARSGRGRVTAPVTAQARVMTKGSKAGKILLQYWYWHLFNGAQGFSVLSDHGPDRDAHGVTRWEWWPLAIHTADWEHTTVTLTPVAGSHKTLNDVLAGDFDEDDYELESVYYTVHSEVEDEKVEFPREGGTHPVVYSHLNSHACYAVPGDYWNKDPGFDGPVNAVLRFLSFGRIKQIKIVDIGFDPAEAIRWSDYEIYDVSDATEGNAPDWCLWKGHWGDAVDQTNPSPVPAYVPSKSALNAMLSLLRSLGKLKKFVKAVKKAPRGPFGHWNWVSLDVLPDDWVPTVRPPPPVSAVIVFLTVVAICIGSLWALLSCAAVLLLIVTRLCVRRFRPSWTPSKYFNLTETMSSSGQESTLAPTTESKRRRMSWSSRSTYLDVPLKVKDSFDLVNEEDEDTAAAERLLSMPYRSRESFETDRPRSRRHVEWIRDVYARWKKTIR